MSPGPLHGSNNSEGYNPLVCFLLSYPRLRWKWASGTASESKHVVQISISHTERKSLILHPNKKEK